MSHLSEYILKMRMDKARQLLLNTSMKAYEVSEEIGYLDPAYFIKVFRKCFGMTPQEYRDRKMKF
ncbi:helix-turn-helix transcriptional regulator [Paenibacillus sp. IHBB 10380]|uniref:helix-turn-helix transcriptional regulator n=1 Tax=Paenibacillus sp. IHBB 10380 TaxID=1566358 RepID=UPI002D219D55|nr:helix-turn-helix domain-containing protein [Paenibacillus sp. IHBB 10380]